MNKETRVWATGVLFCALSLFEATIVIQNIKSGMFEWYDMLLVLLAVFCGIVGYRQIQKTT